jgi:rhodanese-related sulfurtransferase
MAQEITRGIKQMLDEANQEIRTLNVEQALALLHDEDHVFVDIRDVREIKREGKIPGSYSCPRGMLEFWIDPESPYHKDIFNQDKTYVFYCAGGLRSALATQTAQHMGLKPVCHIGGGFAAWKTSDAPIDLDQ